MPQTIKFAEEGDDDSSLIRHHESRLSRNSTGTKEEFITPREDDLQHGAGLKSDSKKNERQLLIVFVLMVFIGLVKLLILIFFFGL